ncbi:MAG TPA: DegT/DnrJ/EryC1/StrS family aminotransferase [Caulobacteraceae bacterium]
MAATAAANDLHPLSHVAPGQSADFVRFVDLQLIPAPGGNIAVAEVSKHVGFPIHRAYVLSDVPAGGTRGAHGHRDLRQAFICLRGSVLLSLSKRGKTVETRLSKGGPAAVVAAGCWRDLSEFSADALVLVLASEEYDEADYIRDRWDFQIWEAGHDRVTTVPYLDLRRYAKAIGPELELAMRRVVQSGAFIGGDELGAFERAFAGYCDAPHAVGVGNGLDALSLALRAWGIGPGDEVIAPAHTFIATVLAIQAVGAKPVLVDVEPDTGLMDIALARAAITPNTRAIIPVHLYGHPVDMDALREAVAGRSIHVLEDACQAHGARYKGRRCGGLGDAAAFSFYPTKNLGALGDGGALVTNNSAAAQTARKIANYGATERYHHDVVGVNSRLDPIQAAVLSTKLPMLEGWNDRRRSIARRYLSDLADIPGLDLPATREWAEPVWHVFAVRAPGVRDALQAWLSERGIGTNIHYPIPVHRQGACASLWRQGAFPVAEALGASLLSLPLDPLHTDAEIAYVISAVTQFFRWRLL